MATSWWLLADSLAPVCVTCLHAGCVIPCRLRAPDGAILAAALLALMKKALCVRVSRGTAWERSPARRPEALAVAAVALFGCLRRSRNMRDASSPRQATSSGRRTARPRTSAKEADMTEFIDIPGGRIAYDVTGGGPLMVLSHGIGDRRHAYRFLAPMLAQARGVLRPKSESDSDLVSVLPLAAHERQARGRAGGPASRGAARQR
jgi:hypothetical protein